jgi:hypothetical protein
VFFFFSLIWGLSCILNVYLGCTPLIFLIKLNYLSIKKNKKGIKDMITQIVSGPVMQFLCLCFLDDTMNQRNTSESSSESKLFSCKPRAATGGRLYSIGCKCSRGRKTNSLPCAGRGRAWYPQTICSKSFLFSCNKNTQKKNINNNKENDQMESYYNLQYKNV